jgi:hypothetical protein
VVILKVHEDYAPIGPRGGSALGKGTDLDESDPKEWQASAPPGMGEIDSADGCDHHQDQDGSKQRVNNQSSRSGRPSETDANQEPMVTACIFNKLVECECAEMLPKEDNRIRAVSL